MIHQLLFLPIIAGVSSYRIVLRNGDNDSTFEKDSSGQILTIKSPSHLIHKEDTIYYLGKKKRSIPEIIEQKNSTAIDTKDDEDTTLLVEPTSDGSDLKTEVSLKKDESDITTTPLIQTTVQQSIGTTTTSEDNNYHAEFVSTIEVLKAQLEKLLSLEEGREAYCISSTMPLLATTTEVITTDSVSQSALTVPSQTLLESYNIAPKISTVADVVKNEVVPQPAITSEAKDVVTNTPTTLHTTKATITISSSVTSNLPAGEVPEVVTYDNGKVDVSREKDSDKKGEEGLLLDNGQFFTLEDIERAFLELIKNHQY